MIPRDHPYWDHPICAVGPPWPSDCYPPSEWETSQDLSDCLRPYPEEGIGGVCGSRRPVETPRQTRDVIEWTQWCSSSWHALSCEGLLFRMKWALDYLGAHPWCVIQEYIDQIVASDLLWSQGYQSVPPDFSRPKRLAPVPDSDRPRGFREPAGPSLTNWHHPRGAVPGGTPRRRGTRDTLPQRCPRSAVRLRLRRLGGMGRK